MAIKNSLNFGVRRISNDEKGSSSRTMLYLKKTTAIDKSRPALKDRFKTFCWLYILNKYCQPSNIKIPEKSSVEKYGFINQRHKEKYKRGGKWVLSFIKDNSEDILLTSIRDSITINIFIKIPKVEGSAVVKNKPILLALIA